jgi:DNA helicase-2/ATP-dependent DNA helicase PcrA
MYRTNAQSRAVEEALIMRGLRYQIVGGTRFYERKEIKDVLAYLRVVLNPADSVSLERIINTPKRGIGAGTVGDLNRWAGEQGVPVYHALRELADEGPASETAPFSASRRKALLGFLATLDGLMALRQQLDLPDFIAALLEKLDFYAALKKDHSPDEANDRWNNLLELQSVADDYVKLSREDQLATFLEEVALVADIDSMNDTADTVTCITLHQAKGLEFPVVFLVGLEEKLLPHIRSMDDKDMLNEERRLLYVGATRARERLYLLYAFRRTLYGRTEVSTPSRFLADIPRDLLKQGNKREQVVASPDMFTERRSRRSSRPSIADITDSSVRQRFVPGQRVSHGTFGEGIVISSKLIGNDEEVVVNFADRGEKKLLASFARLQSLD